MHFEHLLEPRDMPACLLQVAFERIPKFCFDHLRQRFEDLVFGTI